MENGLDSDPWLLGSELVSEVLGLKVPEGEEERLDEDTCLPVHGHHPLLEVGGGDVPLVVLQGVQVIDGVVAGVSLGDGLQVSLHPSMKEPDIELPRQHAFLHLAH